MEGHQFTLNRSPGLVIVAAAVLFCTLQSCSDRGNQSDNQSTLPDSADRADERVLLEPEAESALRTLMLQFPEFLDVGLSDVVEKAAALQISTDNFLEHTDAETLATVREAWLSAHNAYEQTTLYRKLFALFAEESQVSQLTRQQYFIDYWPIYAGYIDYLDSYPGSGLVNDMTVALTPESVRAQHGLLDIHEVTLGFHALEFLLWGENVSGNDTRPYDDFFEDTDSTSAEAVPAVPTEQLPSNRRRQLLALGVEALSSETDALFETWSRERASNQGCPRAA